MAQIHEKDAMHSKASFPCYLIGLNVVLNGLP
jgi:hypothetical protein